MRVAFEVSTTPQGAVAFNMGDATNPEAGALGVVLMWAKGEAAPRLLCESLPGNGPVMRAAAVAVESAMEGGNDPSPLRVGRALLARMGVQVVWDPRLLKYRNAGTMKDSAASFLLTGTGLTIETAEDADEDAAKRIGAREVTAAMIADPTKAATLAAWFTAGQPVERKSGGKAPAFVALASLARGEAEKALAAEPVRKRAEKED